MLYAMSESGTKILATPKSRATCPLCEESVISKCGDIKVWHWAHVSGGECDSWYESETDWHLYWKSLFPTKCVEVTIKRDGQWHRADVLSNGVVMEFQHSPISPVTVRDREMFYGNMLWVFDAIVPNLHITPKWSDQCEFVWHYPKRMLNFVNKPLFLDTGLASHLHKVEKMHLDGGILYGITRHEKLKTWLSGFGATFDYMNRMALLDRISYVLIRR